MSCYARFFPDNMSHKKKGKPLKSFDAEQEDLVKNVKNLFKYDNKPLWSKVVAATTSPMSKSSSTYIDSYNPICDVSVPPPPIISGDGQITLPTPSIPATSVSNICDVTVPPPTLKVEHPCPNNIPLGSHVATTIILPSWPMTSPVPYEPLRYIPISSSYGYVPQNALSPPCYYPPSIQFSYQ